MLDLKHATMTTEARAIVTVRGYGFCPDVILKPSSPVENDVREPDWSCLCCCCGGVAAVIALVFRKLYRPGFNLEFETLFESI